MNTAIPSDHSVIPSGCERISSAQNPKIKNLLLLQEKSRARREQGLFVVEGRRELQHCLDAGFAIDTLFVSEEFVDSIGPNTAVSSGTKHVIPDAQHVIPDLIRNLSPKAACPRRTGRFFASSSETEKNNRRGVVL